MKTAVMTDSNSGIKPEEGEKLGVFSLSHAGYYRRKSLF